MVGKKGKTSKKLKILLTRTLHEFAIRELRKNYDVEIHKGIIPIPRKKLLQKIKDKDGLICFPYDIIDKEVIDAGKKLVTISTYSVGYDHIDVPYAKQNKISIGYTPDVLTNATADLTISLILDLLRRVTEGDRLIRNGKWRQIFGAFDYVGTDIEGKTLGILGLGRIGQAVAQRASAFGMKIVYHNRKRLTKKNEMQLRAKYVKSLELLFRNSDVLSIHIPYSNRTHELVNINLLKKMKKTSFVVNTARGKIIKEDDLIFAIKRKLISGAALDVFKNEPIKRNHPFVKMENIIMAPHIGSSTSETRENMTKLTVKNLKLGLARKRPVYHV